MDCTDSSWNSGDTGSVKNSPDNQSGIDHPPVDEDSFQCTFFRQPKSKFAVRNVTKTKIDTSQPTGENSITFNFSDTCTDSESEFDEPTSTTPCLQTVPTKSSSPSTIDDQIPQPSGRALVAPRVTFDRALHFPSNGTAKSCLKKPSIKEEENGSIKVARSLASKKEIHAKRRDDPKRNTYRVKFGAAESPDVCKHKIQRKENCRNIYLGLKGILSGERSKRSYHLPNLGRDEESTCKRKRLIEKRIVKNKRLLKSMKEVIREIEEEERPLQLSLASVQSIKPLNKTAEIDLTKLREQEEGQKPKKIASKRTIETKIPKPIFKKPELVKLLDISMHEAVKKYRTCRSTWKDIRRQKFIKV
ncbi:unnamed protein product [Xylocopa violacea]|uniref:Uncharacterized protein n=1 Tax=Xylocopa violacea TaxID=135666 RepID=A0ABP1PBQ3_XYLVO